MIVALIPVKDLSRAKSRLKDIEKSIRIEIVKTMLKDVIHAYTHSKYVDKTVLITPDVNIGVTVSNFNIDLVQDDGSGQIKAYFKALESVSSRHKLNAIIFGVADTPFISNTDIDAIVELYTDGYDVVLTPSINGGTNIMLQRYPLIVELMHGRDSFQKHLAKAIQKTVKVYVYSTLGTSIDIDTIEDVMMAKQLCIIYRDREREVCRILHRINLVKYHV